MFVGPSQKGVIALVLIGMLLPFLARASFTRSLKLGDSGEDVRELQQILNSNPKTQVSGSGIGSSGQETTYFGSKTQEAVIRFQNLYPTEVLAPAGLLSGNGFVGPLTIKKLQNLSPGSTLAPLSIESNKIRPNEAINIYQTDQKITDFQQRINTELNAAVQQSRVPDLSFASTSNPALFSPVLLFELKPVVVKAGDTVYINGMGLTTNNNIYFGSDYIVRNISGIAGVLSFKVPAIPNGRYDIAIKNASGQSNTTSLVINSSGKTTTSLTSISPNTISYGDTVTFVGKNFSVTNNDIVCTFGTIKNMPSSNGTAISVKITPGGLEAVSKTNHEKQKMPVDCFIINDNGNTQPQSLTITY